jgi:hypothetical protein
MKRIIYVMAGVLFLSVSYAQISQTEKDLMKKYWDYRDRYKKHFVKIGAKEGESIPISLWYKDQNCGDIQGGQIKMGDAMAMHGDYNWHSSNFLNLGFKPKKAWATGIGFISLHNTGPLVTAHSTGSAIS